MRVLLIGEHRLSKRLQAVVAVHRNPFFEDLAELRSSSASALCGLNVWLEVESIAVKPSILEIRNHIGYGPSGIRSVTVNDNEQVDITLPIGRTPSNAPENDDPDEIVDLIAFDDCLVNSVDECSDRFVEFWLFDGEYRVVFVQPAGVDRDVVSLWGLPDTNCTNTIEEINGPPDRRASHPCRVDEVGDGELGFMGVDQETEDVICCFDPKDAGVGVRVCINADSYILFRNFGHCLISRNEV